MSVDCNPPVCTGHETYNDLQHASPDPARTQNRKIANLWNLPNISGNTHTDELVSHGAGNAELLEINSSEICGFDLDADDESYGSLWIYPVEIDLSADVDFRVIWGSDAGASTGSYQFKVLYTPIAFETTALAVGAAALDTVIADDKPIATAFAMQATTWGTIDGGTVSAVTYEPGEAALAVKTYVDVTSISDGRAYELQARYYRRFIG